MECIIFFNDGNKEKGSKKLDEIISEKNKQGIKLIIRSKSSIGEYANFSDGERWTILPVNTNARGYRWIKAYVDSKIPIDMIQSMVEPKGIYKIEDYKIF